MTSTTGLIGYCQPLKVHGGETVDLKISSNGPETCDVTVYRMICGDIDPNGPGESYEGMDWGRAEGLAVRHQPINAGSFGYAVTGPVRSGEGGISLTLDVYPTRPGSREECLFHWGDLRLSLNPEGRFAIRVGGSEAMLETPCLKRHWYTLEVSLDGESLDLMATLITPIAGHPDKQNARVAANDFSLPSGDPVLIGAALDHLQGDRPFVATPFNGKISKPAIDGI